MRQATHRLTEATYGQGFYDVTPAVEAWVGRQGIETGLLTLFCRHTSASLIIQENADPTVRADLSRFLQRIAPEDGHYAHADEGPDDMPAHIKSLLTQTALSIPVLEGRPALGTWQGIYLAEHRRAAHRREIVLHLLGS